MSRFHADTDSLAREQLRNREFAWEKGKLLPAAQLHEMETPSQVAGTYGLGIFSLLPAGGRAFNHNGDFLAWRTIVYSTANGKRQAIVMVNVNDAYVDWDRLDALAQKALCRG